MPFIKKHEVNKYEPYLIEGVVSDFDVVSYSEDDKPYMLQNRKTKVYTSAHDLENGRLKNEFN